MPADIPLDPVIEMRNQGLSNNQVIQNLQRYGYTVDQINNAINQADLKEGVTTTPYSIHEDDDTPTRAGVGSSGPLHQEQHGRREMRPDFNHQQPQQHSASYHAPQSSSAQQEGSFGAMGGMSMDEYPVADEERIHEIAESIIDEKWTNLIENVNKILDWKDSTESRISKIEQQLDDLKTNFTTLHEGVLGRIGDYDKSMIDLGTEIKALEKVFQKILPGFMENVNELSRITMRMKKGQE